MIINNVNINDDERIDDLHRNGYLLIQSPKRFCFGADAVLLSDFAKVKKNDTVLDIGTGTGIIPILLEAKTNGEIFYGIEIQKDSAEMAERSVKLNNLDNKIKIINDDIKNLENHFGKSHFDVITTNPPYTNAGKGVVNDYSPKAIARHEILCTLNDIIKISSQFLKPNGHFFMIHKPERLAEIFNEMRLHKLEPKTLRFVYPKIDRAPTMVLIEGVRDGKPFLKVLPPLIMYGDDGKYTEEINKIYYAPVTVKE